MSYILRFLNGVIFLLPSLACAQPVCTSWIRTSQSTSSSAALNRVLPEVHDVKCENSVAEIRSSGISLYQFGILANPVNPGNGVRDVDIRLPLHPVPETGVHTTLPELATGLFVNGVPIDNHLASASFEGRNLWHYDLISHNQVTGMLANLLSNGSRHSPIIGFALDGYPIYGPWSNATRMRSGYRLRKIARRTTWPDGTQLTPGQYGPPIDKANPLGTFSEDYEFVEGAGDLDRFNGRFTVAPEYPEGTYAYFLSTDASGQMAYPYLLASQYYGTVDPDFSAPIVIARRPGLKLSSDTASPQSGKPVTFSIATTAYPLEYVHEKPIHLIVVSGDLADFSHIHPERTLGDSYHVVHTFEHGGHYRLYADFTAPGEGPRIEAFDVQVSGPPKTSTPSVTSALHADLTAPKPLRAGIDQTLSFRLSTKEGLQPYLGAWGHFVIIETGLRTYIHAHPAGVGVVETAPHTHASLANDAPPPDNIEVPVAFPHAGVYKLWAQFQVNGEVQTLPFVLRVEPGTPVSATGAVPVGAIRIRIGTDGFVPSRIEVPSGRVSVLALTRDTQPNCASKIVFPDLGITKDLPPGKTVLLSLPAMPARELKFACGMGMYRGLLVVK